MKQTNTIHVLRWENGQMKQDELAALVGVRRETIGLLEHGKYNPSLKLAMDIAHIFGKSVEEVFRFIPETPVEQIAESLLQDKAQDLKEKREANETFKTIVNGVNPDLH